MAVTSEQMLVNAKKRLEEAQQDKKQLKEELADLENELKVEERVQIELKKTNEELAEDQKYIIIAVESEIAMQTNKIFENEKDIHLLVKKCEVLQRDTWDF